MTIDDLMGLLREEFALDIPHTQEGLAQAVAHPEAAAQYIEPLLGVIERSIQASALVGLHGWGGYLQQIAEFAAVQAVQPELASLQWLEGWIAPALGYLDAPASQASTDAIVHYLLACPQAPDASVVELLREMLLVPPALAAEEEAAANAPLEPATAEDLSLATDEVDLGLLSAMLGDAPEQLEKLLGHLDRLAAGESSAAQMVEAQRIAHTFKGSGNIIGLPGIGRTAHRLEDVMEWALEQVQAGKTVNPAAIRDMQHAVGILQHMVAHLQDEEAPPEGGLENLQRLLDWAGWIRDGSVHERTPDPLDAFATNTVAARASNTRATVSESTENAAGPATDTQTLRVGVDRLSRVLRRAGQSIVNTQRLGQFVRMADERLAALELHHAQLNIRLRELEQTVDKQVVQLNEKRETGEGFDPLEMDRYDALHGLSRFVSEAVQDELEFAREAKMQLVRGLQVLRDEDNSLREQHRELLQARLVPVKSVLARLKRNVAQTASSTGKLAQLVVQGENTSLDADVLTRLTEPLLHLLRNAVDHGLEDTEERTLLGKPEVGTVTLSFRRSGQEVEVICADDGRGLDLPTVYDKAVEYGLIEAGTQLSEDELRRLILRPGFSTKGEVTEVSGRGVGMDVVNDRIASLKGRLEIDSKPYEGTRFTLHVPVSTGATQSLIVSCAGEWVALPTEQVVQALAADEVKLSTHDGKPMLLHMGVSYPAYNLGTWLGFEDTLHHPNDSKPCVLARAASGTIALLVDAVVDARELILQDIGRLTRRIAGVVGGAMRGDGKPMFVLDVPALERAAHSHLRVGSSLAMRKRLAVKRTRVLVVDDALSVRRSMQQLLEDAGYDVVTANDGFLALDSMREKQPNIVLTDLEMPNLNGLDLTKRIREVPHFMGMPVIMITSRASDKHRDLAHEAGVDLYLTKPYTDAALLEHVRKLSAHDSMALMG
jgi:chemotaxis protein histidine kinase CheA/ActR/RegA family two-component response regulator